MFLVFRNIYEICMFNEINSKNIKIKNMFSVKNKNEDFFPLFKNSFTIMGLKLGVWKIVKTGMSFYYVVYDLNKYCQDIGYVL